MAVSDTERLDIPIREQPGKFEQITIGTGAWIGERALVAASIGKHCIIGAGAVVTKPIPDFAIAVGSPAKVIRYRTEDPVEQFTAQDEALNPAETQATA